jgi:opacity protein-like surface antigen
MKKVLIAALAALALAAVAAAAFAADPPVTVKLSHKHYVITGSAPDAAGGNIVDEEIFAHGHSVASDSKAVYPTTANGYKFKVTVKKSELPAGRYILEWVDVVPNSSPKYIKFHFKIAKTKKK